MTPRIWHALASMPESALETPRTSADVLERLEGAGHLPSGTAAQYLSVIGFRSRVVHLYDRIDPQIVYRILVEDRRDLASLLGLLLVAEPDRD